MDGHAGGLVEDQQILVLVDDVQGAGGAFNAAAAHGIAEAQAQGLAGADAVAGGDPAAVQGDAVWEALDVFDPAGGTRDLV